MPEEKISFDYSAPKTLSLKLSGEWLISSGLPSVEEITSQLSSHPDTEQINFDTTQVNKWDSGIVSFALELTKECSAKNIRVVPDGLQQGVQKLLTLALKVHEKSLPQKKKEDNFLESVGGKVVYITDTTYSALDFLGDITVGFWRMIKGKVYFRWADFLSIVQRCGSDALPLVSLISLLIGMILAFIGAMQLQMFGAQIYVADIVGIGMVRVMGAVMTAVIMSGRTGAAYAAELGLMQTNEEIDALKTLGVSPVEFLVLPRILALVIMMPLLTLYADFMGIVGGFLISTNMLGINPIEYLTHTHNSVKLNHLWVGLVHSFVFGVIIAVSGCFRGMRCERSAAGVGEATTSAVVTAITASVIATAIITFVCQVIGV